MRGALVLPFAVAPMQDRALAPLTQHEVDGAGHPWDERDHAAGVP